MNEFERKVMYRWCLSSGCKSKEFLELKLSILQKTCKMDYTTCINYLFSLLHPDFPFESMFINSS